MKKILLLFFLALTLTNLQGQKKNAWPHIIGFDPELHTTLTNPSTLIGVLSLAALSYGLEEHLLKNHDNINYYTARTGMNNEYGFGLRNVWHQNGGVEHRIANWFSISAEFNLQEWHDQSPLIDSKNTFGIGTGLLAYFRWYLLGKLRVSPYIEYGTGIFLGFSKFPYNGTHFTFTNSTQLGIEYTLNNLDKIRLGYGNFNQTNYNLLASNPAYNGNGFSISYSKQLTIGEVK